MRRNTLPPDSTAMSDPAGVIDAAPVMMWITTPDGQPVHFNRAWLDFAGREADDELGLGWLTRVHPEDVERMRNMRRAEPAPFDVRYRLRRHDGAWRWVHDRANPRWAPEGNFLGHVGTSLDVTEQVIIEAAAQSARERLDLAQEAARVGTYDWDVQAQRITWTPQMFRLYGIDPDTPPENIYNAWLGRLHPEDRDRADRETLEFVRSAGLLTIEFRVVMDDGEVRWINGRGRMFRAPDGTPLRMIGVNMDATDRRRAENALRESEQRLHEIAATFPGVIFRRVTYPDGRVEFPYLSRLPEEMFPGQLSHAATDRTVEAIIRLFHPDGQEDEQRQYHQAAAQAMAPLVVEGQIALHDGGPPQWVQSVSNPHPREDGAIVWDGFWIDTTAERQRERDLERSATMLRMGMEVAGIGTWEFDPVERTIQGSTVINRLFGLSDDAGPLPLDAYVRTLHHDDAERVRQGLVQASDHQLATADEYRVIAPDGSERWVVSHGAFVQLADGTERILGALSDMTDRKRQEHALEQSLHQHQLLLRELNHRIKNNLAMVTSILGLQLSRMPDPVAADELQRAIDRVRTVAELHSFFGYDPAAGRVNFGHYLQQYCKKMRASILTDGPVTLECRADACPMAVESALPMGLIVNELVTNSLKYAFPDGASGRIEVTLERASDAIVLTVADDGIGLGAAARKSGLGTRLVEGLCRQLGGTIEAGGSVGTRHELRVPLKPAEGVHE